MNHLLVLPILLPLFTGAFLLLFNEKASSHKRVCSTAATLLLLPLSAWLIAVAGQGQFLTYALGDWPAPFGIVLVLDRLSALMVMITAVLASAAMIYAIRGDDARGRNFHALFQFQIAGLNGAFLTGDLFNLYVFFEILLIASYALLLHGSGRERTSAGLHYVLLNLLGSSLFLIAVGTLYGLLGTLNMADLARRITQVNPVDAPLIAAAGGLLLLVFALKAALLPLYFWLPRAYAGATAPVAALFAVMTKMGVYSILRVYTLLFGPEAGELAQLAPPLLWPLALATLALGSVGALAAKQLQELVAYLVLVSVGLLLAGLSLGRTESIAACLYYLIHTTWITGGLFLLSDLLARQRGDTGSALVAGPPLNAPLLLSGLFFFGAVSIAGLPPLSGFLGKVLILRSATLPEARWLWPVLLLSSLGLIIALSRAGSTVFWRTQAVEPTHRKVDGWRVFAVAFLMSGSVILVVIAKPLTRYLDQAAEQMMSPGAYIEAVLQETPP
ncbi:multicomponent K+:H+ antiporter subunit D [Pseudomonas duriflava]|uniref:Multicomponent K+:H+ antiporter subunit D n=1 Tax=Pseudomonas duriflava TaxID=459528 RepID=A0A562PU84_9PSED|nr:monovalent cation/H+ antiporter subunit D [Pseudomonas duriflava]TWI48007.1 multicomponent K+:H+ antiporter subunit D [Pseudomonas duriflava]